MCDSSTRRDLHVFALLRFDIVKNSLCIYSFFLVYKNYKILSLIHLALVKHSLEQIWSTPICYGMTGLADLIWDTSISNQAWKCDGVMFEILSDLRSDLRSVSGFFMVFNFEISKFELFFVSSFSALYPIWATIRKLL